MSDHARTFNSETGRHCCDKHAVTTIWGAPHPLIREGSTAVMCPVENVAAFNDGPDGCSACGQVLG